jgi:hypothetical protein
MAEDAVQSADLSSRSIPWWLISRTLVQAIILEVVWLGFFALNLVQLLAGNGPGIAGVFLLAAGGVLAVGNVPSTIWLARQASQVKKRASVTRE